MDEKNKANEKQRERKKERKKERIRKRKEIHETEGKIKKKDDKKN